MRWTLTGELPRHLYVWVDSAFTHRESAGFVPAIWFGLVSYPSRMWGCTVLLESGAVYRNLPVHALALTPTPAPDWTPEQAQTWDCYGWDFATLEYSFLRGLECLVRTGGGEFRGEYLFTAVPVGDGWSAAPEQAKEFTFVRLENGRLTVQPTDRLVFRERSFTNEPLAFPRGLRRQTEVWSVE